MNVGHILKSEVGPKISAIPLDIQTTWRKLPSRFVKCNYDCIFKQNKESSQAAWIIRDSDGFYLRIGQSRSNRCKSPLEAELQALLITMQHVWSRG